ncbi:cysteine desulfurase [Sneathiella sp. CAU 1612]|uniref:Cysteine desulfurase n=1 Tax=Sneathiella sedimenti TaxID=2816034 RepID=A0ABS3F6J6_9PROT|nr:cysteine desulfurase family protein [Sneathiella sedimenti]MBO0334146.1 cysteine desulfurase [Sneathiella sedimenti]
MASRTTDRRQVMFEGETLTLPIYLDYQASTPLDHRIEKVMTDCLQDFTGNPHSSTHRFGHQGRRKIEEAQDHVAALINARPHEIIFTAGATEANNLALLGIARARTGPRHIISGQTEHESVLQPLDHLAAQENVTVTLQPVDKNGLINLDDLMSAIRPETILISIMAANNETGVCQNLSAIGQICKERRILFHTDAVQALATEKIDVRAMNISLLSLSAHKLYGPMGIGALYVRDGTEITPLLHGGAQQRSIRPGTLPTALCTGLGEACRLIREYRSNAREHLQGLRARLIQRLEAELGNAIELNGEEAPHIPGCVSLTFKGIEAEDLLHELPDLALSTGSACSSTSGEPSHVLRAMGQNSIDIAGTIRLGIGQPTTVAEVNYAAAQIVTAYRRLIAGNAIPSKQGKTTHHNGIS